MMPDEIVFEDFADSFVVVEAGEFGWGSEADLVEEVQEQEDEEEDVEG